MTLHRCAFMRETSTASVITEITCLKSTNSLILALFIACDGQALPVFLDFIHRLYTSTNTYGSTF